MIPNPGAGHLVIWRVKTIAHADSPAAAAAKDAAAKAGELLVTLRAVRTDLSERDRQLAQAQQAATQAAQAVAEQDQELSEAEHRHESALILSSRCSWAEWPALGFLLRNSPTVGKSLELDELVEHWTLLDDEQALIAGKRGATRLGIALLLKFYGGLGRFPRGRCELPDEAVAFVARQIDVPASELGFYEWSGSTIAYHRAQIREHLGFEHGCRSLAACAFAQLVERLAGDAVLGAEGRNRPAGGVLGPHWAMARRMRGAMGFMSSHRRSVVSIQRPSCPTPEDSPRHDRDVARSAPCAVSRGGAAERPGPGEPVEDSHHV